MRFIYMAGIFLALYSVVPDSSWGQMNGSILSPTAQQDGSTPSPALTAAGSIYGGIPTGQLTPGILKLSLQDALTRGLQYNLGIILGRQSVRSAEGARIKAGSEFLPTLTAEISESGQQINLAAFGFSAPGFPSIVGPFSLFDGRLYLSQKILDFNALNKARSERENVSAAEYSFRNTREQVMLLCGTLYLQASAGGSRIDAVRAQLTTAEALYNLAVDQKKAGVAAGIDVLRSQVEMQQQQQRLIVAENEFEKVKLALARAIGLPLGQQYAISDSMPDAVLPQMSADEALAQAYVLREDYHALQARTSAAEAERKAVKGERLPSLDLSADFGDNGRDPTSSHGTFAVMANLRIPIFQGRRIQGKLLEADAAVQRSKAELEDLRGRIYYEVQNSLLDLRAAADRVQVARSSEDLAREQVAQARDRFSAGVANTVEVVQAQESLAKAAEDYIASLYSYNLAKIALAKALGIKEESYIQFLRGM